MLFKVKVVFTVLCVLSATGAGATNYYVHPELGNDQNPGTSQICPLRSLEKAGSLRLLPGDTISLAAGQTFYGSLTLTQVEGAPEKPVVVTSYFWGNPLADNRAVIDARGYLNGIYLADCRHIVLKDLIITANGGKGNATDQAEGTMRCGVMVTTTQAETYAGISLCHLWVREVFFEEEGFARGKEEVRSANGTQRYGWGIRFINETPGAVLQDLLVRNCVVSNVAHTGIKFTGRDQSIQQVRVYDNQVLETGGPGIQLSGVRQGHIQGNYIDRSGSADDSRKWGRGSGLWTWGCSDIVIERNYFMNANGPGDSAGCHIDFNCRNIVVQYNFSANNAGGFCEILGNNYNCAYRYNISVDDGRRVKGENGAFQEGKTFWLSGYQGNKNPRKGPFNSYFYNNTIYVGKDIVSKIAVDNTSEGILIANNIFYIEGQSQRVLGDQLRPEEEGQARVEHIVFQNNLYLQPHNWPQDVFIQDSAPLIGDPQFLRKGRLTIFDYIPTNTALIKDKGMEIPKIPGDPVGLVIGLRVEQDILGNALSGKPDLGAIELE